MNFVLKPIFFLEFQIWLFFVIRRFWDCKIKILNVILIWILNETYISKQEFDSIRMLVIRDTTNILKK